MFKVMQLVAAPASLSFLAVRVHAAAPENETSKKNLLKVDENVYGKVLPRAEKAMEYGKEGRDFLKNPPPGFYPRLGVIGFAGIVGLFLSRGSKMKRLVYPIGFMGIGASLYYPQQAIAIAKVTGSQLYDWSLQAYITIESLWKENPKKKRSAKVSDKGDADRDKTVKVQESSSE
ncbi:PREDICTED: MICOS complex subunit MIC26 isoform X2 [Gekko japonicus]|uniref:MICOS complex subunit n=1 Tax=Gekko japonicus TaxID=146911 RepID=A0ABM1KB37_GEKJA|nr:PREDICTED: MICOS complex subunit MIC26 isoform X2 [Gekko japonicus]